MVDKREAIVRGRGPCHLSRLGLRFLLLVIALDVSACASAPEVRPSLEPLLLDLVLSDGTAFSTDALLGKPVLLFFFTTYDSASQYAFIALSALAQEQESRLQVVGVALQPEAEMLLPMYAETLSLPLPLAYEPKGTLLAGESALGELGGIPQYVLLSADGHVLRRQQGVMEQAALSEFVDGGE